MRVTIVRDGKSNGSSTPLYHVHSAECPDLTRGMRYRGADSVFDTLDLEDVSLAFTEVYPPDSFLYEVGTDDDESFRRDVRVFPCASVRLPEVGDAVVLHVWAGDGYAETRGTVEFVEENDDHAPGQSALILGLVDDDTYVYPVSQVVEINGEKV